MKDSMQIIIHSDQKGFMPGRKIATNIRKVFDLVHYSKTFNVDSLVLSLDYRKCFDMISFDSIIKSLEFFGFNEYNY